MIEATVNGVTFSSLGLGVKRHDIPVLPETKDYIVEIAGRDGAVDFGSVYGARSFSVECVLMADNPTLDYHAKIARVAVAFNTKRDLTLTFSDLQGRRYNCRYAGTMAIEKIIFDGNLTIPFKMFDPWPEGDEIEIENVITESPGELSIMSDGTVASSPVIYLKNNGINTIHSFYLVNEYEID
jgi:phage-related protein